MVFGRPYINKMAITLQRSSGVMQVVINPQTGKRKHAKPENHSDDAHPKESVRTPVNPLDESIPVPGENEECPARQKKADNREESQGGPENRMMSCLGI